MFSALVVASASVSTDHGSDVVSRVFLTSCTIGLRGLQCAVAHQILRSVSCVCNSACPDCHLVAAFGKKDAASEPRTADTISSIFFVGDAACVFFFRARVVWLANHDSEAETAVSAPACRVMGSDDIRGAAN